MRRGRHQVLFNFLPGAVVDYSDEDAFGRVASWRTQKLDGVNRQLLVEAVSRRIGRFPAGSRGYPSALTVAGVEVLTPRHVELSLFPLSFYCLNPACQRVVCFRSAKDFEARTRRAFRCPRCNGKLQQFDLLHWHTCGWSEGLVLRKCKVHGDGWMVLNRFGSSAIKRWWFECRECKPVVPLYRVGAHCKKCAGNQRMTHGPFRQGDAFYAESLSMVDLGPVAEEGEAVNQSDFETILAGFLGFLDDVTVSRLLRHEKNSEAGDPAEMARQLVAQGVPEDYVKKMMRTFGINDLCGDRTAAVEALHRLVHLGSDDLKEAATEVREFRAVTSLEGILSLNEVIQRGVAAGDPMVEGIRGAPTRMRGLGLSDAWVARDLPVLLASFGFSRGDPRKQKSILNAFPSDRDHPGKTPIYANRILTEAIAIEVDRPRVLRWLGLVEPSLKPPTDADEQTQKAWLLNNLRPGSIEPFSEIPAAERLPKALYTLTHTLAHTFLASASSIAGLDKNSMSEILFPSVPAFVVYSNSSADFQLGGMFTLFESQFATWVDLAIDRARRCLYDPMCSQAKGACHACLHLAEVSCVHANKDLDRAVLVGGAQNRFAAGFWEPRV